MKLIPELNGRKIILYMPSWRKDKETRKTAMLSLSKMQTALQDKYMVVLHFDQAGQKEKDLKQYEILVSARCSKRDSGTKTADGSRCDRRRLQCFIL